MELRAELLYCGHAADVVIVQHVGVKAAQPDALNAGHLGGFFNQLHQARTAVGAVARQADGRQHDLLIPGVGQAAQFLQHARLIAAAHRTAGARNNAVGAAAVAAVLDLDKGAGVLGKLIHGQFFKALALLVGADVDDALLLTVQHLLHVGQNRVTVAGAGHNVRLGDLGGLVREGLRVAPCQHGHSSGVLALGTAQPFAALLVAEVRHGAAVDDVDIRTFFIGDNGVAVFLKQLGQRACFILVYLAAQGVKSYPHVVRFLCFYK